MAEIQSLAKGLKILNLLEHSRNGMGTTEVAAQLEIDKSSASRLLHTLANYGFVEQDGLTARYLPGTAVGHAGAALAEPHYVERSCASLPARTGGQNRGMRAFGDFSAATSALH